MGYIISIIAILIGISMVNSVADEPMIWEKDKK